MPQGDLGQSVFGEGNKYRKAKGLRGNQLQKHCKARVCVCVCGGGEIRGASGLWLRVLDAKCDGRLEDIFSTGVTFDYFRLHGDHLKNAVNQKRCVYETKEPTT